MPIFKCDFEILLFFAYRLFLCEEQDKMAFKPIDPKRDEFRRYLERSGVIEALTKVFVRIVKERPENPLDYLRRNLGDALHQADSLAYLQSELEEARHEIQRLRSIIESVNPDALMENRQSQEDIEKKCNENSSKNQDGSESVTSPQEESKHKDEETETQVQKDITQQQNDMGKNSETLQSTDTSQLQSDPNHAQKIDDNS